MQAYTQEVSKLTSEIKKRDADRTDMSAPAVQRRRRERERLQSLVDQLNQEFKNQTVVYQTTKNRLAKEKESWFDWTIFPSHPINPPPRNRTVMAILQHCIVPRCLFGPNEAIFSAKFLKEMHRLGTKNFSTLTLYDKVFPGIQCLANWLFRSLSTSTRPLFSPAQITRQKITAGSSEKFSKI
jgi:THO complex subunit 2